MQSQNAQTWQIFIEGRVQGVGYRRYSQKFARRLELAGWAPNRNDGRVEILVTGSPKNLEKFLLDLKRGPPGSTVSKADCQVALTQTFTDFVVAPTE